MWALALMSSNPSLCNLMKGFLSWHPESLGRVRAEFLLGRPPTLQISGLGNCPGRNWLGQANYTQCPEEEPLEHPQARPQTPAASQNLPRVPVRPPRMPGSSTWFWAASPAWASED